MIILHQLVLFQKIWPVLDSVNSSHPSVKAFFLFCLLAVCFCTNGRSRGLAPLGLFTEPLTLSTIFTGHHPQVFYYLMWQLKCRETGKGTLSPCLKTFLIPIWWCCNCVTADIKYLNLPGSQRNTAFIKLWCLSVTESSARVGPSLKSWSSAYNKAFEKQKPLIMIQADINF